MKLLEYFEGMYGVGDAGEDEGGMGEGKGKKKEKGEISFNTEIAERESRSLREAPDVLEAGLLGKFVQEWAGKWNVEDTE